MPKRNKSWRILVYKMNVNVWNLEFDCTLYTYHDCHFNVQTIEGRTDTFDINHWWNTISNNLFSLFTFTAACHGHFRITVFCPNIDRCIGQLIIHGYQHRLHTFAKCQIILTVQFCCSFLFGTLFSCRSRVCSLHPAKTFPLLDF